MKKECIAGDQIRFTVNIPNEHLKSWYDLKEDGGYVKVSNASIVENGVKIRQDCTRINGLIRRSCGEVKNKCRHLQGRTRVQYLQRLGKIAIRQEELINVGLIEEQIKKIKGNAKQLLEENEKIQKRCEELYTELQRALKSKLETENNLIDVEENYEEVLSKNKDLRDYIEKISPSIDLKNNGKPISEVGERQQRRKLGA